MGYQPRKSPRGAIREYRKALRQKSKDKKHVQRRLNRLSLEENRTATEKEVSEGTLKRLHTLGCQKFGSFPYSEHFNRWLLNVEAVLNEFESHPDIRVDEQFVEEHTGTIALIKVQLEGRRVKEASVNQETRNLSEYKNQLDQINKEYSAAMRALKDQRNSEIRHLNKIINQLKKEQEKIIRVKTGFFRGISRKDREQKEAAIVQELGDKQRELELVMLDFSAKQKKLREEYLIRREPVLEKSKHFQKRIENIETDGSLEERWFACEALIDSVNSFLQRKATQQH